VSQKKKKEKEKEKKNYKKWSAEFMYIFEEDDSGKRMVVTDE
jgi:hypothetical protein